MSSGTEQSSSADLWDDEVETEIEHDDYDPTGTLALIGVYFLIIAGLWVFMYFFEFLGRGPSVV
jgi:predicted HAD superfamily phosphohydrolase